MKIFRYCHSHYNYFRSSTIIFCNIPKKQINDKMHPLITDYKQDLENTKH